MKFPTCASVTCVLITGAAPRASAQYVLEGNATWTWEASADEGATWSRGRLEVDAPQQSVFVRASCQFSQVARLCYFGLSELDATITGVDGAGSNDWVSPDIFVGVSSRRQHASMRFGSVIKIDHASDTLPPGEGTDWLRVHQNSPSAGGPSTFANPIDQLLYYQLNLDGSPGDRLIGGVFRQFPTLDANRNVIVCEWLDQFRTFAQTMTQEPLTIRVVPAPAPLATLALLGAGLFTRRRRF